MILASMVVVVFFSSVLLLFNSDSVELVDFLEIVSSTFSYLIIAGLRTTSSVYYLFSKLFVLVALIFGSNYFNGFSSSILIFSLILY